MIVIQNDVSTTQQYYGIRIDTSNADSVTAVTRIGCPVLHNLLPIQNRLRACLLTDDGSVNYYLNPTDWTRRSTGQAALLDGTDGQVMIEFPPYYVSFEESGQYQDVKLSEYPLSGFSLVPRCYVGAYEASLERSTSKLCSVKNSSTNFRGGTNNSEWDASSNTLLGRPVTNITRTQFRTYARNRGSVNWNAMPYEAYKSMFWLYYVEYANLNSQNTIDPSRNASGYSVGGLGSGVTNIDSRKWNSFNMYNPFVPCGHSNSIASGTGSVNYTMPAQYDPSSSLNVSVNRYRGIENPFGHIWKNLDGVNLSVGDSGGVSTLYVSRDPSTFNDSNYVGYELRSSSCQRMDNYVGKVVFGPKGDIVSSSSRIGGSLTYYRDYYYGANLPASGTTLRTLLSGGHASYGGNAGFAFLTSLNAPSSVSPCIGSRLCYYTG